MPSWSRRVFLLSSASATFLLTAAKRLGFGQRSAAAQPSPAPPPPEAQTAEIALTINGQLQRLRIDLRTTLLDALRNHLGLTGTKKGCDLGQCGACTVLADGRRINACLALAVMQQGKDITTIEGLAKDGEQHPVQAAFIEQDAFQCGYCTPGQIMSAVAFLSEGHEPTDAAIREWMSGNLCRCGAYPNIVEAIKQAAHQSTNHAPLHL